CHLHWCGSPRVTMPPQPRRLDRGRRAVGPRGIAVPSLRRGTGHGTRGSHRCGGELACRVLI
ncbi:MAG: hypothetical protein AVDCRST_MAG70-414, partial [uncultured Thermomicrobiales bacterium]